MLSFNRHKSLLYLKTLPVPLFLHHGQFPFSLYFCTTTSDAHSFRVSYLIENFGFSPETALKLSKQVHFNTSQNPDSVLTFFRNHGFSDLNICNIVRREPSLLSCDPIKTVLPKFEFLVSKGASSSDVVRMVARDPRFLRRSLENHVIPTYELVSRFLKSDKKTLATVYGCPSLLRNHSVAFNLKMFVDNGVSSSNIFRLLRVSPFTICGSGLGKTIEELKGLGFIPSKPTFGAALIAKRALSKSGWNEKIDTYKSWGWSEETVLEAFWVQPNCMLASKDKINAVMRFWVNELGWDSSYLVKGPGIFGYSLNKRIIPRATVVHHILSKGLRNKSASLVTPFFMSEKLFLERYVECFEEEEASQLSKLYQEKMNLEDKRGNDGM